MILYGEYRLSGECYEGEFINRQNIEYLLNPNIASYGQFLRSGVIGFMREHPNVIVGDVENCFEQYDHHFVLPDTAENAAVGTALCASVAPAFMPTQFRFYDTNAALTYYVVFIDGACELRQANYVPAQGSRLTKNIDNHTPVKNESIIKRMEFSFQCLFLKEKARNERMLFQQEKIKNLRKPLCEVFGIKNIPYHVKTVDAMMDFLERRGHICYIDWKLDYEDVLFNFNRLLKVKNLSEINKDAGLMDLVGEDAVQAVIKNISWDACSPVMMDAQSDGFYIALLDQKQKIVLESLLADIIGGDVIVNKTIRNVVTPTQ